MFLAPVAAQGGKPGERPPNTKFLKLREWESILEKNFVKIFQIFIKIFLKTLKNFLKAFKIFN